MINLHSIIKYFHKGSVNEVLALRQISLRIEQGDFITVIGSNGAGKSTLLNCLAGCFFPDSGSISFNETDITSWPEHRRASFLGRVFQDPLLGTCASLSIEQNMALAALRGKRRGLSLGVKRREKAMFRERLASLGLGLENRLRDKVGLLSGGQRQALTMLMATLQQPEALLLDEHTAALDPKTARQILDITQKIVADRGLTALMVTHNMNQAIKMGNRLIMLHRGQIILDIEGEEKKNLTVEELLERFYSLKADDEMTSDRMLLV
ncbi:ABC transporter ATP-binding protein [Desulfovibrio inopinatus]|uniref:ABC transporter ATP-binding protein n=1 Tax=Desulfovibrio inopinatus TaxID=102109 RepID=UPI0004258903|nr:ABC transporter ATP-binding protein [Desulfovibrio inopinatus]